LAVDSSGNLLIADGVRLRRINSRGVISTVAGDGYLRYIGDGGPAASATLARPSSLFFDARGNLLFADPGMHRVRRISPSGIIETVAGTGLPGFNAAQFTATLTPLDTPSGVAADPAGAIFIADTNNQRIRKVNAGGTIATLAGTGTPGSGPQGVPADQSALRAPRGVCADG